MSPGYALDNNIPKMKEYLLQSGRCFHGDRSETGDIIYLNFFSWRNFAMNKS